MTILDRMLDALTTAYHRATDGNIGKLFSIFADSLDEAEETAARVRLWRGIDGASGATLDLIGRNFGVPREGTPDAFYRLLIKTKMIAHISGGDIDTVIHAVSVLLGIEPEEVSLTEIYPAKIRIAVRDDALDERKRAMLPMIYRLIKRIVAAGIWIDYRYVFEASIPLYLAASSVVHRRYTLPQVAAWESADMPVYVGAGFAVHRRAT